MRKTVTSWHAGWFLSAALLAMLAVSSLAEDQSKSHAPVEPANPALIPVTATPGYYEQFPKAWMDMHRTNLEIVSKRAGAVDVVLLGDSITLGWGGAWDGKPMNEVWQKHFGALRVVNLGIGGDKTQNILWRLENGEVAGLQPKLVILAVGVNNVWNWSVPAAAIASGVKQCVETVRAKLPGAKVLVINVFPTQEKPDAPNRHRANEVRAEIAKLHLDDGTTTRFVDFGDKYLEADGTIAKETMGDFLHPTLKGYETYATEIGPLVAQLLK